MSGLPARKLGPLAGKRCLVQPQSLQYTQDQKHRKTKSDDERKLQRLDEQADLEYQPQLLRSLRDDG